MGLHDELRLQFDGSQTKSIQLQNRLDSKSTQCDIEYRLEKTGQKAELRRITHYTHLQTAEGP